jgi:hypothetical protein
MNVFIRKTRTYTPPPAEQAKQEQHNKAQTLQTQRLT